MKLQEYDQVEYFTVATQVIAFMPTGTVLEQ